MSHPLRVAEPGIMCSLRAFIVVADAPGGGSYYNLIGAASVPSTVATIAYEG